jgi:hypothetical protein
VSLAGGLLLALASTLALNWSWVAQHEAASSLPPLSVRRPLASLALLFRDRAWLVGFLTGIGGWALYVGALALAPLSLVQAVAAGGIGLIAYFARARGATLTRAQLVAAGLSLVGLLLLGVSLGHGAGAAHAASPRALALWLACSAVAAALVTRAPLVPGAGLGAASGILYAAGDVGTKSAVAGGLWLLVVPVVLAAHGGAFAALQLAFQRGTALASAGVSTLFTNALPIVAGVFLFHERTPNGVLGGLRILAFTLLVVAGALLSARPPAVADSRTSPTMG